MEKKYIDIPNTTDFGILFLPTEGLYAEVLRRPGVADAVQRDFRVIIAGPTTLAALLNSLQMGFRTLAIKNAPVKSGGFSAQSKRNLKNSAALSRRCKKNWRRPAMLLIRRQHVREPSSEN